MYISEWTIEEDGSYYQATVSLKENLTPSLKVRIIPLVTEKEYSTVIRDYNSDLLLFNMVLNTERENDDEHTDLDIAKKAVKSMVGMYLTD